MPEKRYPVSPEVRQRRRLLERGYSAWGPGSGAAKNVGIRRKQHYVRLADAALEMGYADRSVAARSLMHGTFELPVVYLQLPPKYHRSAYVRRAQLDEILKAPPPRMRRRLERKKKKGLARSSG